MSLTTAWVGQIVDGLAVVWVGFILADVLLSWFMPRSYPGSGFLYIFAWVANWPVNLIRRLMPTAYREWDFAPWFTILALVLLKTFVLRALIYWGLQSAQG
jgi:uncharacterized protein YggT (Ycf19 family)